MKLVTAIPAGLAQATDVVDRNIVSNLDISQQSPYPIETVADLLRSTSPGSSSIATSSFATRSNLRVVNGGAVNSGMVILTKGLWRINALIQYIANFVAAPDQTGCQLIYFGFTGSSPSGQLITLNSTVNCNLLTPFTFKWLLNENIALTLQLAGNAAGQDHTVNCSLVGEKYL